MDEIARRGDGKMLVRVLLGPGSTSNGHGETIEADDVVCAIPAWEAARATSGLDEELARGLARIPYLGTATIALAYRASDVAHPLDALGIIFPKSERRPILAATFISSKWEGRAPKGCVLLRVFVGGYRDPGALSKTDAELVELGRAQLGDLVGAREPLHARVYRFERSNPQPIVGHAALVRDLRARAASVGGLWLAGAAYDGVGIPDCVRQANEAAAAVAARARR
jgi:oxygen-dependent protoporphyrinogen oxidase